jgi:GDSL-like Lipase/Acylhydrolase family
MSHLVLLGDSILDNEAYTKGGPDVITQVRALLPNEWKASLLAIDGSTTNDVPAQVARLPHDATHLVLSVGGNDALMHLAVLEKPVSSVAEAVAALADIVSDFEVRYRVAIAACMATRTPLTVCTIYNGCFADLSFQRIAATTLTLFNDAIMRVATDYRISVIDLRSVCMLEEDYANPIEPSSVGGQKIARVIVGLVSDVYEVSAATRIIIP